MPSSVKTRLGRRTFLASTAATVVAGAMKPRPAIAAQRRPNILLILAEDLGPQLGSYGDPLARTPNLDKMAAEGARFTRAFTTSPVCSPSRSSLMTGMYSTSINAHNHQAPVPGPLPPGVRMMTEHLRDAGYFTANVGGRSRRSAGRHPKGSALGSGKTHLNFRAENAFEGGDWSERGPGQPFFAQLTIMTTHRSTGWPSKPRASLVTDPAKVKVPPYYPDHPVVREDLAGQYDAIAAMDLVVGRALQRLADEGLADNTIVIFMGDNGSARVRGKQFLYDTGIHVPLIIWGRSETGRQPVDDRLVTGNDIAPTILGMAGLRTPDHMHGQDLYSPGYREPEHVVATRDLMDVAVDRIRCVRTKRFKYIRNYLPAIPYMQINPYMERNYPVWNLLRQMDADGRLSPVQALFTADRKPVEELYDLARDPHEVSNLAFDPAYRGIRDDMRRRLDDWARTYGDDGAVMLDPLVVFQSYFGASDPADVVEKQEAARRVFNGGRLDR